MPSVQHPDYLLLIPDNDTPIKYRGTGDRRCDGCGIFMHGIKACSDKPPYEAPRSHCIDCEAQMDAEQAGA